MLTTILMDKHKISSANITQSVFKKPANCLSKRKKFVYFVNLRISKGRQISGFSCSRAKNFKLQLVYINFTEKIYASLKSIVLFEISLKFIRQLSPKSLQPPSFDPKATISRFQIKNNLSAICLFQAKKAYYSCRLSDYQNSWNF